MTTESMTYCEECGREVATTCNACVETVALDAAEKVRDAIAKGLPFCVLPAKQGRAVAQTIFADFSRERLAEIIAPKGEER